MCGKSFLLVCLVLLVVLVGAVCAGPKASAPSPGSGTTENADFGELTWAPGADATSHDVYFDVNETRVTDANRANPMGVLLSQAQEPNSYNGAPIDNPTNLRLDETYYWRIDGDNGALGITKGNVWSFTIDNKFIVDDFESYTGTITGTKPLKDTWTSSGGTGEFYGLEVEGSGDQAISIGYWDVYCGVMRPYSQSMDYTFGGAARAIVIRYKADSNVDDMHMKLTSGTGGGEQVATVTCAYPSTGGSWSWWWIGMSEFEDDNLSLDLTDIRKIEIGLTPFSGQSGDIYFDGIELRVPCPGPPPEGDLSGGGEVDYEDIRLFCLDWQQPRVNIVDNPQFTEGVDSNGWPVGWSELSSPYDYQGAFPYAPGTGDSANGYYTLSQHNADGHPGPCARLDMDVSTNTWTVGDLYQVIDVNSYVGQTMDVSFRHKANLAVWEDSGTTGDSRGGRNIFEFRPGLYNDANFHPGSRVFRRIRMNPSTCDDCWPSPTWDWEKYGTTLEIDADYLHLYLRLCGRWETTADPPRMIRVDEVVVKPQGASLRPGDFDGDNDVDFYDYDVIAHDWLYVWPIW